MSTIITQEIKDCQECNFCKATKLYTADSWEHASDYWCTKVPAVNEPSRGREQTDFKMIAGYIEWPSEMPGVPSWCPLRPDRTELMAKAEEERRGQFQGDNI